MLILFLSLLFIFTSSNTLAASNTEGTQKLIEFLAQEKTNLAIQINSSASLKKPNNQNELDQLKQQNEAMLSLIGVKILNLEEFLIDEREQQNQLNQKLKRLQQSSLTKIRDSGLQERISKLNTLREVNKKAIDLIKETLDLAKQFQKKQRFEKHRLDVWQAQFDAEIKVQTLRDEIASLQEQRNDLYQKNIIYQQQKDTSTPTMSHVQFELNLLLNNQRILLLQDKIQILELKKEFVKTDYLLIQNPDIRTLKFATDLYRNSIDQLDALITSLHRLLNYLPSHLAQLVNQQNQSAFNALGKEISDFLMQVEAYREGLEKQYESRQQQLKKEISARQSVTNYQIYSWMTIFKQFINMPGKFYQYLKVLILKLKENYIWLDGVQVFLFWFGVFFLCAIVFALQKLLKLSINEKERERLSAHVYDGLLILIYRNVYLISAMGLLLWLGYMAHLPFSSYQLLINLLLVWLVFRSLVLLARQTLLDRVSDVSGNDVTLYYRLKHLLQAGGWSMALMVFSHQLPLSSLLQDFFNRLFMLFLLALAIVLWNSKDIIPYLLRPILKSKKRYVRTAVRVLILLVPITLFTTAIIGLIGYINLAWQMSRYQAYILMVITGYVLIRGLFIDLLELISEWMISNLRNGWLWIEVFLKPIDKILRISLILLSVLLLFQILGWHSDSWVVKRLYQVALYPIVNFSGIHITLLSTIEFIILLFIFIWAAKWTREFCYRWLYSNARDAGIRNSLSVFTQYAVILIGGFITLRVLGLDFSGMSMILGGLAVGMGFGLRDFASNIIGGIMLLIERPVREGDLITLGEYEGRVAHIGIRSMRVSSWDNMEVLIPNAETFNKPFTNWTHQDYVVRTVLPIKVAREDDLLTVQRLILDVLNIMPEILDEPPPQVFLKQIDEALIEFEVRYFINVEKHTRFEVRSKVLFAISAQFKAAGIKPPIPPFSVEVKEYDDGDETIKKIPQE